jgi:hypothetical protein
MLAWHLSMLYWTALCCTRCVQQCLFNVKRQRALEALLLCLAAAAAAHMYGRAGLVCTRQYDAGHVDVCLQAEAEAADKQGGKRQQGKQWWEQDDKAGQAAASDNDDEDEDIADGAGRKRKRPEPRGSAADEDEDDDAKYFE